MTDAMPPVVNEGGNEVADRRTPEDAQFLAQVEKGGSLKPAVPSHPGHNDDAYLGGVDQNEVAPPAF